jgi:hypothetical protein
VARRSRDAWRGGGARRARAGAGARGERAGAACTGRRRRRAECAGGARGGGGERAGDGVHREDEWRERRRRKNERAVYFLSLPSARDLALGKDFLKILKYALPSALDPALGKGLFAECSLTDTRQRIDLGFLEILCRVSHGWHSAKASLPSVQAWTLGKVYFYFLNFINQTFCGMFLYTM